MAARISVIDDDGSVRRSLARLLRIAGYDVETFGSADEFLDCSRRKPACLVLDILLPGVDGIQLQRRLVEQGEEVPVVAISGNLDDETRRRSLEAGAAAFLNKPFSDEALLDAITQAIAES